MCLVPLWMCMLDSEKYDTGEFALGMGEQRADLKDVPYLDVSATYHGDEVIINVVNRHKDKAITTDIIAQEGSFTGEFEVYEVNGPDVKSENDFGKTNVETVRKSLKGKGEKITYSFPAHSYTLIKAKVRR